MLIRFLFFFVTSSPFSGTSFIFPFSTSQYPRQRTPIHAVKDEWDVARKPCAELGPEEVVPMLMRALRLNDYPYINAGLQTVYDWSSDMCRLACGRNVDAFIQMSKASVFGMCIGITECSLRDPGLVGNDMFSVTVEVPSPDSRPNRFFLWQLRKERRPPAAGAWLVHAVIASDYDGEIRQGD